MSPNKDPAKELFFKYSCNHFFMMKEEERQLYEEPGSFNTTADPILGFLEGVAEFDPAIKRILPMIPNRYILID